MSAPIRCSPMKCMSSGREPIASPPGSATFARPARASSGPSTQIEPRILRTSSYGASHCTCSGVVIVTRSTESCCDSATAQPRRSRSWRMIATSEIAGRLPMTVSPGARRAAAMSFRTLFFAPTISTVPARRAPPVTRSTCTEPGYLRARAARSGGTMACVAIHLTRIYTRTGDDGTTALGDMSRVRKTDPRVGAYADCDEANAALGVALALGALPDRLAEVVRTIQNDLFDVSADLCTPVVADPEDPPLPVDASYVERLEGGCAESTADLRRLPGFTLPGGTPAAALLPQARPLARRAERSAWALYEADPERTNRAAMLYLNRLSDLLFILSRVANPGGDVLWKPGGERTR